jgi:adenylate cyclase class 2
MKEVEVKARVKEHKGLEKKLLDLGCNISGEVREDDKVFVNRDEEYTTLKLSDINFIRIRKRGDRVTLTLKRQLTGEMDCIEREVEISNAREMEEILEFLGYHIAVELSKKRRKTEYNGYEICLDDVEGLGLFVEVEKMTQEEDSKAVQEELFDFLKSLGIDEKDRVFNGYDTLVYLNRNK